MKAAWLSVATAAAASVCCIGPVVAVTLGAGALTAAAVRFEPYRPAFVVTTFALLGFAFYRAYRPVDCAPESVCPPAAHRRARQFVWVVAIFVAAFLAFPYYVEYLF